MRSNSSNANEVKMVMRKTTCGAMLVAVSISACGGAEDLLDVAGAATQVIVGGVPAMPCAILADTAMSVSVGF
jgi:hypothetical protein